MKRRRPKLGSIYQRGSVWWIKYYRSCRVFRESSHSESAEDAERLIKRRQGEIVTGRFAGLGPERVTLAKLFDALLDDYRVRGLHSLPMTEHRVCKNLAPFFGTLRAADFSTAQARAYVLTRRREGAANATINRELELLRRAFRLAYEADPPVVVRVPHIARLPERNVRSGVLDHPAYLNLRDVLSSDFENEHPEGVRRERRESYRLLLVVGYHTGARLGELLAVRWSDVDLARCEIRLESENTKTGKARVLPIYGEMHGWFEMARAERDAKYPDCRWVFAAGGQQLIFNWRAWRKFVMLAGVPDLRFHDLRRTALTNMVRAGIPEKVAMEISGHLTRRTFERYHITGGRSVAEVGEKMAAFLHEVEGKTEGATGTLMGTIRAQSSHKLLN
jgi:integrase